jgi:hypothetical protein
MVDAKIHATVLFPDLYLAWAQWLQAKIAAGTQNLVLHSELVSDRGPHLLGFSQSFRPDRLETVEGGFEFAAHHRFISRTGVLAS